MKWMKMLLAAGVLVIGACEKKGEPSPAAGHGHEEPEAKPAVTNRVDIPAPVRRNLGITFAKVERRAVASTLRVPGRFELLPTAKREYRTALGGRVEVLVSQFQKVEAGTVLARIDSNKWREMQDQIVSAESALVQAQAKLDSMGPLRAAHVKHEESLSKKVAMWSERTAQLEELKTAGGGSGRELAEARATLNATQAELAETMEKDAELKSRELELWTEVRAATAKQELVVSSAAAVTGVNVGELLMPMLGIAGSPPTWRAMRMIEVRASAPGVVESIGVTNGGLVEDGGLVLTVVRPEEIRFHARGLQSDLGRIKEGLGARIVPPQGGTLGAQEALTGTLTIGLSADADERTIDLIVTPEFKGAGGPGWARAGVSALLEVTLEGGAMELAAPLACVVRDGARPIMFRRDPADADKVIRMDADVGVNDGRWVVLNSGVKEGDEIVLDGVYPLMLATAGNAPKGGHFHSDGTFHEGKD